MSTHLESGSVTRTVSNHAADLTVAGVADYVVVNASSPNTPGCATCRPPSGLGRCW